MSNDIGPSPTTLENQTRQETANTKSLAPSTTVDQTGKVTGYINGEYVHGLPLHSGYIDHNTTRNQVHAVNHNTANQLNAVVDTKANQAPAVNETTANQIRAVNETTDHQISSSFLSLPESVVSRELDDAFNDSDHLAAVTVCFLQKVYSWILLQMAIIIAVNVAIFNSEWTRIVMMKLLFLILPAGLVIYIVTAICVHVCEGPQRRAPGNFVCLSMFTVALLLMLGLGTAHSKGPEMFVALATITLTVMTLGIFAFVRKFAMWIGFAICAVVAFATNGAAYAVGCCMEPEGPSLLFCSFIGALFFGFILVHTAETMVGGRHRYNVAPSESVFAAATVYVDVWNFFFFKKKFMRFA